jgi:menaquinone-dependent protoporphyrinogen oxidase
MPDDGTASRSVRPRWDLRPFRVLCDGCTLHLELTQGGAVVARILVVYGTTEGQTAKIADVVADALRAAGHDAQAVDVGSLGDTLPRDYDGVVVGASIHMGKHDKHVVQLVRKNLDLLERLPSAFFSVSLAAHGDAQEAEGYVDQFEEETGWRPARVALFGGALLYTQYGFVKQHLMRKIAKDKPGELGLDMSRDYVYTEWDAVRRFAEHFAVQVGLAAT